MMSAVGTFRTWRDVLVESASLIGRLGSSAFRLSTTTVSMSLAGSCFFSSESAPGPLYGAFFVKEFARAANLLSFVSFFVRSQGPFLRPDPRFADVVARRSCQGWPPRQACGMLRACQAHTLTAPSTTARLVRSG